MRRPLLSRLSKRSIVKLTILTMKGVMCCLAVSVAFTLVLFWREDREVLSKALFAAILLPILLATPLFAFVSVKLYQISKLNRELKIVATHDGLTGLLNRTAFTDHVKEVIDRNETTLGCVLLLVDADFFKSINDRFGHAVGDEALRRLATALSLASGEDALVGRLGGEEFGIFFTNTGPKQGRRRATAICAAVRASGFSLVTGDAVRLAVSIGGCSSHEAHDLDPMLKIADERLYTAKTKGRDRVEFGMCSGEDVPISSSNIL